MRCLFLLLLPAVLLAGQPRYARLGEFQGQVEVQLSAADPWIAAERNLPLTEATWIRTGSGAQVELEFDEGSVWRLGPNSQGEISDYNRLSTGQRTLLLSLDHGIAWFTGEPRIKDVLMLVVPGAHVTVTRGSRIRITAEANSSQVSVIEGQVRFSSPSAEMDLREGTTAKVEPARQARFFLYSEVPADPLDRWSEDRDKAQANPQSGTHVNAHYGLADLDAAGKWMAVNELGIVWKPEVAQDWAPYQKGRWRYFETLGYTWVSDDAWGWLPYHNGRWARRDNVGWVWQPDESEVFHPAEVYWLRGSNFTGWGPLAPGEQWIPPVGATPPLFYSNGNTTFAAFQPDVRSINPAGFPAPTPELLKTASFVVAPPSPAFLISRLDAARPPLKVGSTRILPSVSGITMGDGPPPLAPPEPAASAPYYPPPTVSDSGVTPPPDGVYPVPVVGIQVIEVPVVMNAPDHPDYSRRPGVSTPGTTPGTTKTTTTQPAPAAPTRPPAGVRGPVATPNAPPPVRQNPTPAPTPVPPASPVSRPPDGPVRIHADPVKPADKKIAAMLPAEQELYRQVLQDVSAPTPNYNRALVDLTAWTRKFPTSSFETDRSYYYVHVYNALGRADKVLETASPLVAARVSLLYPDQQQVLQILFAASTSGQKIAKPDPQQLMTARRAAQQLLEFIPDYFSQRHKPADIDNATWASMRAQVEAVAHLR